MQTQFAVETVVQVPLHDVDTTKADCKTSTLIVVEVVQKKDNSCAMYCLAGMQSWCFGHVVPS